MLNNEEVEIESSENQEFDEVMDDTNKIDIQDDQVDHEIEEEDILDESEPNANVEGWNWYIVQCYALYEKKVQDRILQMKEKELEGLVERVLLPEEETVEIKNNERKEKIKKMFPGYLFVQMKPDETAWYLIRRLPGVAKLVGTKHEPTPVSEEDINRVLRQLGEKMKKIEVDFEISESIKVISGPFRGYTGTISEISPERGKLKSLISIFGRETPVELDFDQVEKYVDNK